MRLEPKDIEIGKIMLDPNNPRFMNRLDLSQHELQQTIMNGPRSREAKELLSSMKEGIKWVNRIVVRSIGMMSQNEKNGITDMQNYEFIIVEGNTRLACLKSGHINGFDSNSNIPVLEAKLEDGETLDSFQREIHLTQGIANVTVVKEWPPIAKARHLHKMHVDKKASNSGLSMLQINKSISSELGLKLDEVRKAVIRFSLREEIARDSDTIDDSKWPFLEAFDQNDMSRGIFGLRPNSIEFEWKDNDEENDEISIKKELLNEIPKIIESAEAVGIFSKEFRGVFRSFLEKYGNGNIQDIRDEIFKLNRDTSWSNFKDGAMGNRTDVEAWSNTLDSIIQDMELFPSGADWASTMKDKIGKINNKANKHLRIIEVMENTN